MKNFAVIIYLSVVYAVVVLVAYQMGINHEILYGMGIVGAAGVLLWPVSILTHYLKKLRIQVHLPKPVFTLNLKK